MRVSVESGDRVIYDDSGLSTHGDSPMPQIKVATEDPVAQRVAHDTQAGVDISEDPEKARERRLTQLQLERFRRSMSKATRRTLHPRASVLSNDLGVPAVRKVHFKDYPWSYWVVGVAIAFGAVIFVTAAPDEIDWWWKTIVGCCMGLISIGFVVNGRTESLVMNKDSGTLVVRSAKPMFIFPHSERRTERELRSIYSIRVVGSGKQSGSVDTRSYKIQFEFADGSRLSALESQRDYTTHLRCSKIKAFHFGYLADILPVEESVPSAFAREQLLHHALSLPLVSAATQINKIPLSSVPSSGFPRKPIEGSTLTTTRSLPARGWVGVESSESNQ